MCTWDNKPWRLVLRCCMWRWSWDIRYDNRRKFRIWSFFISTLQLWNKIALSSRWPPSFKSLKITSSFLSLCSYIEHKALKKCSNFRTESLFLQPLAISFLGGWDGFSKSWLTTVFGLFALQVCCTWYVGMCLNNGCSRASIISGFILLCCCVLVRIFLIAFLSLKCWLEDKLR